MKHHSMGRRVAAIVVAAGLFGAFSASAHAAQAGSPPQREGASERRTCVVAEVPHSRIPRVICKTAQEWENAGGFPA